MRRLMYAVVVLSALVPAGGALAQQPIQMSFGPKGPVRYPTEEVVSVRFLGEAVEGPTFTVGEQLELVTEKDGWVRVKKGDVFGWVPAGKLAESPPEAPPAPPEE